MLLSRSSHALLLLGCLLSTPFAHASIGDVTKTLNAPGSSPEGMAWDGTNLWVSDNATKFIYKIDPGDGHILSSFSPPLPNIYDITWMFDSNDAPAELWATDGLNLYNLDALDGHILKQFTAPGFAVYPITGSVSKASGLASPEPGFLWLAEYDANTNRAAAGPSIITKLDISGAVLIAESSFPARGHKTVGLEWDGQYLWASDSADKTIQRLDTNGNVREKFTSSGDTPTGLTFDGQYLWCDQSSTTTDRLDRYDIGVLATPSTVSGTIFGSDGQTPLAGASVRIVQNGVVWDSMETDPSGDFQFQGLYPLGAKAGAYSVQAYKQAFLGQSRQLTIVSGQDVQNFDISLAAAALGDKVDAFPAMGFTPTGLEWDENSSRLWMLDDASDFVLRFNPSTGLIDQSFILLYESNYHDMADNGTELALISHVINPTTKIITNTLSLLNKNTGEEVGGCTLPNIQDPFNVPQDNKKYVARGLTWDGSSYWLSYTDLAACSCNQTNGRLTRIVQIDTSCQILQQFTSPSRQSVGLGWDGEGLRVADNSSNKLYNIDILGNNRGFSSLPKEDAQTDVDVQGAAFGDDSSWITTTLTDQIWRFDAGRSSDSGSIQGTVRQAVVLDPIGGVRMRLLQNGRPLADTTTGPDGTYLFQNLPPLGLNAGSYTLRATKQGFVALDQTVVVEREQTVAANFQLDPSALGDPMDHFPAPSVKPSGVVMAGGVMWVADDDADFIYKVDPATGLILAPYPSPSTTSYGLAFNGTCLLMADGTKVRGIDPATGSASASCADIFCLAPGNQTTLTSLTHLDSGYLMGEYDPATSSPQASIITRTDESCNALSVASFPAPYNGLQGLAWDGELSWASDDRSDALYRLDSFGNVYASFEAPGTLTYGMAVTEDRQSLVLADATTTDPELSFIDGALGGDLGTITGTVFQADGTTPIPGCLVRLLHNGRISKNTSTLDDGTYRLTGVPLLGTSAGSYTLQAQAPGYGMQEATAQLSSGHQVVEVLINLAPAATGKIVGRIPAPSSSPTGQAWDGSNLWLGDDYSNYLFRIDPTTGLINRVFPAPSSTVYDLAWDDNNLWVVGSNLIYQVNPIDGTTLGSPFPAPVGGEDSPHGLTWDGANLWVSETAATYNRNSVVSKLDASGNIVPGTSFPSPGKKSFGLAWDGVGFWADDKGADKFYKLSTTGTLEATYATVGKEPEGATFDGNFLWIADSGTDSLHRMDVGQACIPLNPFSTTLDPSGACFPSTLQLVTNGQACDGNIELHSTDNNVVTVSADGLVTAVDGGDAQITATCSTKPTCSTFVAIHVLTGPCPTATPTITPTPGPTKTVTPTRTPGGQPVPAVGREAAGIGLALLLAVALAGTRRAKKAARP